MNIAEQKQLLDDMDGAAYECAGALMALVALHDKGALTLPPSQLERARRMVSRFVQLQAAFFTEDAMMKAAEK